MLQADINNYRFNYLEKGRGKKLVLVHGSASDYRTWDKQLSELGKYFHVFAYSRRFHWPNAQITEGADYSMTQQLEDLEAFLIGLNEKEINLVGHSYGAFLCLLLAMKNPGLIGRLVLAEPPVITLYVSNIPKPLEIIRLFFRKPKLALCIIKFGIKGIAPAVKALQKNEMEKALDVFGSATLGSNTFRNLSKERIEQAKMNLIKAELLGSGFLKVEVNKVKQIKIPTLLISGQNSPKLWHFLLEELDDLIPNSRKEIISSASHIMHEDNGADYNSTILSFLK